MDTTTLKLAGWHDEDTATEGVALFCYAPDHDSAVIVQSWTDTDPTLSDLLTAATRHTVDHRRYLDGLALVHRTCTRCGSDTCPGRDELNRCTAAISSPGGIGDPGPVMRSGWGQ